MKIYTFACFNQKPISYYNMSRLDKYLNSRNAQQREYCLYWLTAFGIQSVVQLKPSDDLYAIITRHIEGDIDIHRTRDELREFYNNYHRSSGDRQIHRNEEADKVAVRIVETWLDNDFELSLDHFSKVHRQMFHGIYHNSGELREKPFSKKEWVLDNASVIYPKADRIEDRLEYVFDKERSCDYSKMSKTHQMRHYCEFIASLFMLNAFHYANSRATFVFAVKYMLSRGFHLQNDTFYREAWFFRNAIIRAFYTNMHQGIYATTEYMEMFMRNLFFNEDNTLKNHRMVIRGE